ncbi:MAG: discoidin domain-containing protein [Hyphomicrobiaceae bacterium]|nr:discoidin domain-containing protein [Hyphomicrobiaceae bacterium]
MSFQSADLNLVISHVLRLLDWNFTSGKLDEQLRFVFGQDIDVSGARTFLEGLANGTTRVQIEIVDGSALNGALGAFAAETNTIYLSSDLKTQLGASDSAANVLLEELGHYIDANFNASDASGDEGALFAAVVQGTTLSDGLVASLRAEDDQGSVVIGGKSLSVEFALNTGGITLDGMLNDWSVNDRVDGVAPVTSYEVYGQGIGNSYVFAIHAPNGVVIGPNTTIWLNTDRNPTTGFDIFAPAPPYDGGAEYNINFDANGVPHLYSGSAGGTLLEVSTPIEYAISADGTVLELAIAKADIGNPTTAIDIVADVNDGAFLPGNFSGPQYTVYDLAGLPQRTDFSKKVAIVYSDSTAQWFFGDPSVSGQLQINMTAYSQLFMMAQNQAGIAGVPFDVISESDLTDLSKLVNYDAIVFPSFQYVDAGQVDTIETNLNLLARYYDTSFITSGNFMTNDVATGAALPDAYDRMKALFDLQLNASGFPADIDVKSAGTGFGGVGGYTAGEAIRSYDGTGFLAFTDATPADTPLGVIANQTIDNATTYNAIVTSEINGDRNVHFSTAALMGDNNQLWQAIQWAVNGDTGPTVGLQLSRQSAIFASRNDMDQSQFSYDVNPGGGLPGIYDLMLPIIEQWKEAYNFVGSYYINIGDRPAQEQQTNWAVSAPYYAALLALGNEIGSHSYTHLIDLNPAENTNILTTGTGPGTFDYEFNQSNIEINAQLSAFLGTPFTVTGAAVPGAPETLATAEQIIQYYQYLSGGYSAVGAGYPGAFGYLTPAYDDLGKVYLAPNMSFDFTLIGFQNHTAEEALAIWLQEFAQLTSKVDVPVILFPWHDYGVTGLEPGYTLDMFTGLISAADAAGSEFVTLADLAQRIVSFDQSSVSYNVNGNTIDASVVSNDAGRFALDLDNLGAQVIANVAGWYAYDNDSVFTPRNGGNFTITLGGSADDVTHIITLPDRSELVSLTGDGTDLTFEVVGEGLVVIDLKNVPNMYVGVTGATVVSQVGDILTLDLGAIGTHIVSLDISVPVNITDLYPSAMHAQQSSVYGTYGAPSILDNDTSTFNHTFNGSDEWVEVNFGGTAFGVTSIEIINRLNAGARLDGATVSLLDVNGNAIYTFAPIASATNGETLTFSLPHEMSAYGVRVDGADGNYLHIAELNVFGNAPANYTPPVNLTDLYGSVMHTFQSSTYGGYGSANIIDNDVLTFDHTLNGNDEWVELNFGGTAFNIMSIDIINRSAAGARLDGATVSLLDANGNVIYTSAPIAGAENGETFNFNFGTSISAYGVRIDGADGQYLHIAELDLYGTAPANYAPPVVLTDLYGGSMTASQSSTYGTFSATNILDNDNLTFNHTLNGNDEWIKLDFGGTSYEVTAIEIINRLNAGARLDGATVSLLDAGGNVIYTSAPITGADNGEIFNFVLNTPIVASSVRIDGADGHYLHIAELNVIGYDPLAALASTGDVLI